MAKDPIEAILKQLGVKSCIPLRTDLPVDFWGDETFAVRVMGTCNRSLKTSDAGEKSLSITGGQAVFAFMNAEPTKAVAIIVRHDANRHQVAQWIRQTIVQAQSRIQQA